MIDSRRAPLDSVKHNRHVHVGLWADRFLSGHDPKERSTIPALVDECSQTRPPDSYAPVYQRWQSTLVEMHAQTAEAKTPYRLAAGLGRESVIELGLTIHHTYGVPYIPGSSLKGVAAAFARKHLDNQWDKGSDAYTTLFGTTESAGYVTFMDALPVPGKWELLPDVITVHHKDYYQDKGAPPADWDDPTPLHFLSARGTFLIAVLPQAGAGAWAEAALRLLIMALESEGVGGKTSSGYGRLVREA